MKYNDRMYFAIIVFSLIQLAATPKKLQITAKSPPMADKTSRKLNAVYSWVKIVLAMKK